MNTPLTGASVITVRNVIKQFGRFAALRGVTAEFDAGRFHAILGDNGAGKTTLLRAMAGLAQSYASAGDHAAARRIEGELIGSEKRYVSPYNIARIYGSLAEPDRALEWLVKAYEEHNPDLIEVTREPTLQGLHGNSKFRELTRRIGWLG